MDLLTFQKKAWETALYINNGKNILYPCLGLIGESGELTEKFKKIIRDDNNILTTSKIKDILSELSDVLWYVSAICSELGTCLNTLWEMRQTSCYHLLNNCDNNRIMLKLNLYVSNITRLIDLQYYDNKPFYRLYLINNHLGNILTVIDIISKRFGYNIFKICEININKLTDRMHRNVLHGSGDNR